MATKVRPLFISNTPEGMTDDYGEVTRVSVRDNVQDVKTVYFDTHKFAFNDLRGWIGLSITRLTDEALRAGISYVTVRYGRWTCFPFQLCVLMYAKTQNTEKKKPISQVLFWEDSERFPANYGLCTLDVVNGVPAWGDVPDESGSCEVLYHTQRKAVVGEYVSKLVGKRCVAFVHPDDMDKMGDPQNMHVRVSYVYQDF